MTRLYSIIISGYKYTTRETLAGCLQQKLTEDISLEIICLDNTRDSRHRAMVEAQFAAAPATIARTLYLPHPVPGKAEAQNHGIREAQGAILIFLDDDVLPAADLVASYDRGFATHDCAAIQGRVVLAFEPPDAVPRWLHDRFRLDLAEMDFGAPIEPFEMGLTGANMAFRGELFQRYGFFDERLGPGRSGTLEDQEFSERIRAGGERQLFWPEAMVRHRIPPERLRLKSFAGIYFDVGHSDFFLSRDLIAGGRFRFTLYTVKQCLLTTLRALSTGLRLRRSDMLVHYCELFRHYGYWKQAMRHLGRQESA
ncbi:MAG: glycosyltransferase [Verrucomicrobia bacterium]|nr:glycosyltransferase [Verrucomicrobiota bacterium]